jgi:hypothetical protein
VPALHNHLRLPGVAQRAEPAWQALGRRAPGLLGYQIVGIGRQPEASLASSSSRRA